MYRTLPILVAASLALASTTPAQTPDRALLSRTYGSSLAGSTSRDKLRAIGHLPAQEIAADRALLGRVENPTDPANASSRIDAPINGSRALLGRPSALTVEPAGAAPKSSFQAQVRGDISTSTRGEAEFGPAQSADQSPGAFVVSLGARGDQTAILFTRRNGSALGEGRYRISDPADEADEILALILTGSSTRPTGVFRGQSGWLVVTAASDRVLTGHFEVEAIGFVAAEPGMEDRQISVAGSISANSKD